MSDSRPLGTLDGGGWQKSKPPATPRNSGIQNDEVLTQMFEMFLDSLDVEIIQTVVESCKYNRNKSMETLLAMCSTSASRYLPDKPVPSLGQKDSTSSGQKDSTLLSLRDAKSKGDSKSLFPIQPLGAVFHNEEKAKTPSSPLDDSKKAPNPGPPPLTIYIPPPLDRTFPLTTSSSSYNPTGAKTKRIVDIMESKMRKIRSYIENENKIMILMRGCPGSGKSYLATGIITSYRGAPQDYIFSTDDFFLKQSVYYFQPDQLGKAHEWNQKRVLSKMKEGRSPIFIDNTNTQLWEMSTYASLAVIYGYAIEILEPQTAWFNKIGELVKRNTHGVPKDKIRLMLERYEYGLTPDILIKSTGAKYLKAPPQKADRPLTVHFGRHSKEQEQNLETNYLHQKLLSDKFLIPGKFDKNSSGDSSKVAPDQTNLELIKPTDVEGFYFGREKRNLDSHQEKPSGPEQIVKQDDNTSLNSLHVSQSIEEKNFKLFNSSMKTSSLVPIRSIVEKSTGASNRDWSVRNSNERSPNVLENKFSNSSNVSIVPEPLENVLALNQTDICTEKKSDLLTNMQDQTLLMKCSEDTSVSFNDNPLKTMTFNSFPEYKGTLAIAKDSLKNLESIPASDISLISNEISSNKITTEIDLLTTQELPLSDEICKHGEEILSKLESSKVQQSNPPNSIPVESNSSGPGLAQLVNPSPDSWMRSGDWNEDKKILDGKSKIENPLQKPPRSFTSKSIDDYCKSVKDINNGLHNEASGWSFCDNSLISWQPIDKNQQEFYSKEMSLSSQRIPNTQRSKFSDHQVSEKETNTHHADFMILNNLASDGSIKGFTVLQGHDRDINEGTPVSVSKVPIILMLDKGTLTENDFWEDTQTENKHDKVKKLSLLFPNRSVASIKEFLKQCNWDVNYVSNLLLDDTDTDTFADGSHDSDSDLESSNKGDVKGNSVEEKSITTQTAGDNSSECAGNSPAIGTQDEAMNVKRHIEQSIDFREESYSPHLLSIKNYRRGLREGAIPKTGSPVNEESAVPSVLSVGVVAIEEPPTELTHFKSDGSSEEGDFSESLEFVVHQDFIQQLVDKFGTPPNITSISSVSPVVTFPVDLARKIYDVIFNSKDTVEEEDDEDLAVKLQCEEDERIAHQLYKEMLNKGAPSEKTIPQLREIMDMELAQSIYKADVDSLTGNSQETMANVLAKRLLEANYSQVDKKVLHDIYSSCNNSFEDTVKTLQEALSNDEQVFSDSGRSQREQELIARAKQASVQEDFQRSPEPYSQNVQPEYQNGEDSYEYENPWESSDPKATHEKYRVKADEYFKERNQMYQKASDAFRRKERSVAAYYSRLGQLNNKKYHDASAMAAAALAVVHTHTHSLDTLDLHFYKVVEAQIVFDMFIDYHIRVLSESNSIQSCLKVITGRGTHSVNGMPRIKPAVIRRAKKRDLRYEETANQGVIKVWITRESKLTYELPDSNNIKI